MITQPDGSSKIACVNKDKVPGPGSYNSRSVVKNQRHGQRFGSEKRVNSAMLMGVKNPGPNAYNASNRSVTRAAPRYGFGTSNQRPQSCGTFMKAPGPGNYDVKGHCGNASRGASLGKRLPGPKSTADLVPGPGSYNNPGTRNNVSIKSQPNWKIGTASRDDELRVK